METKLNENLLDQKLTELEKTRTWSPRVISKLETLIRGSDDFQIFRINPIQFAKEKNIAESEVIDLFLYASKIGIFQMNWQLLCPGCSTVIKSFSTLRTLDSHFSCNLCQLNINASLDDYIAVTFTISPGIREIIFHHPEKLSVEDYYFKFQFSPDAFLPMPGNPRFVDAVRTLLKVISYLEPGEKKKVELDVPAGLLGCTDRINSMEFFLKVSGQTKPETQNYAIKIEDKKFNPEQGVILPGKYAFEFENRSNKRASLFLLHFPAEYKPVHVSFPPFLQGKRLLTSQTFRNLFHSETIQGTEGLSVKDIVILFTDLKSSTALYDRIGDLKAFSLVQQHFDRLNKVIQSNHGAIVKTIGDAVMASFMDAYDAVKAALLMLKEIDEFNQEYGNRELILKIGIHKGASIVVNLNERLDFFGQTVNIASRVQGLADADQIYMTEDIYTQPLVQETLKEYKIIPLQAKIKGVENEVKVYQMTYQSRVPIISA